MGKVFTVIKKEMREKMNSPITYFLIAFFLVVSSGRFFLILRFFDRDAVTLRDYFGIFPFIFIVFIPALTMNSWVEEKERRNDEILGTLPFSEWQVVAGKFFWYVCFLLFLLLVTLPVPLSVKGFVPLDAGIIASEYIGIILLGSCCIAVGQFVSSLVTTSLSSFLLSVSILVGFTVINRINVPASFSFVSFDSHFNNFIHGILNSADIIYFLLLCAAFLYSTVRVLRIRKWD